MTVNLAADAFYHIHFSGADAGSRWHRVSLESGEAKNRDQARPSTLVHCLCFALWAIASQS